jgi:hypothetical protein
MLHALVTLMLHTLNVLCYRTRLPTPTPLHHYCNCTCTNNRVGMLHTLATLEEHPESVPINALVAIEGTPLAEVCC